MTEEKKAVNEKKAACNSFENNVADMYRRWCLNCLVEIANAVSLDFIRRPQLYQQIDVVAELTTLRSRYGNEENVPNTQQRKSIFTPFFGNSDGYPVSNEASPFHIARKKLVDAAIAFSERVYDTGEDMLRERVRSSIIPLQTYLKGFDGSSFNESYKHTKHIFEDLSVKILKSPDIASIFGIQRINETSWPFEYSSNGAKLIEAITTALKLASEISFSQEKFVFLQRVAQEGYNALLNVMDYNPNWDDSQLNDLIKYVYAWGNSLHDFQS